MGPKQRSVTFSFLRPDAGTDADSNGKSDPKTNPSDVGANRNTNGISDLRAYAKSYADSDVTNLHPKTSSHNCSSDSFTNICTNVFPK